jgi:hypothetical protein
MSQTIQPTPYTLPQNVTAPKELWTGVRVLHDGGTGHPSYAAGYWDGDRVIATRWNGNPANRVGRPRIFVHAAWHVLEDRLYPAVIDLLVDEEASFARHFLAGEVG